MDRNDLLEIMDPRIAGMRSTFTQVVATGSEDRDRLSFLDGQKVYVEIGKDGVGSGYITWDELDGWKAMIVRKPGKLHVPCDEDNELCTFRDALDAFMEEAARLAR